MNCAIKQTLASQLTVSGYSSKANSPKLYIYVANTLVLCYKAAHDSIMTWDKPKRTDENVSINT